ncbi:MAG TPA: energy transducer TonB [Noviherbaspirillum sp.]
MPHVSSAPALSQSIPATSPPPARTSVTDAHYASTNRKPPYPRLSRSNEEQGTVVLRVLVKADGTAGTVEIKNSSGHPLLDESARSTVQTWRFSPATVDGKPVAEWYQVAIPFTLQNN